MDAVDVHRKKQNTNPRRTLTVYCQDKFVFGQILGNVFSLRFNLNQG